MPEEDDKKLETQELTEVDEHEAQDETVEDESTSTETAEEGDTSEDEESSESTFDKRFTQFKGETVEEYVKNLEQGYDNSSKEALRLKKQLDELRGEKLSAVANAESDKKDGSETKHEPQSMTDLWVSQEMKRRHVEQYQDFASKHPEVDEDDELFERLDSETGKYMDYVYKTQGRIPDLGESLNWAWGIVKPEDSKDTKEEKVVTAVKNAGSASKSKSPAREQAKPKFSDQQIEMAKKIDQSLRDKSRAEIEEILAKAK